MKLFSKIYDYNVTIPLANDLSGNYDKNVIYHCYWNGKLNDKHLISIKSCYYFNIKDRQNKKIILWVENNIPNDINEEITKYCEIKLFSLQEEIENTHFIEKNFYFNKAISFYSDVVRYLLLYNYGGCWFDLDIFFLRNFEPLFFYFENEVVVYQWGWSGYPNGAIFISLEPNSVKMKKNIEFIIDRNRGWGFQEANLYFFLDIDMLVLPCSWFDAGWINTPFNKPEQFKYFFKTQEIEISIDNFYKGSFCYHWHNKWNNIIEKNSPMYYLNKDLEKRFNID